MNIGYYTCMNSYVNEVIRLQMYVSLSLLLGLSCCFTKVKMRFFIWMNETKLYITSFIPYFVNKTTSVAHRCKIPFQTLLPYYQINIFRYNPIIIKKIQNGI